MKNQIMNFVSKNQKVIRRVALGAAVVVITGVVTSLLTKGDEEGTEDYNNEMEFEVIEDSTEE